MSYLEIFIYIATGVATGALFSALIDSIKRRRLRTGKPQSDLDTRSAVWYALLFAMVSAVRASFSTDHSAQLWEDAGGMLLFAAAAAIGCAFVEAKRR